MKKDLLKVSFRPLKGLRLLAIILNCLVSVQKLGAYLCFLSQDDESAAIKHTLKDTCK